MIEYGEIKHYQDSNKTGLYIRGHANYVKRGDDIVCAAASVLGQTAIVGCELYDKETDVRSCKAGHIIFVCNRTQETTAIIKSALLGLDQVKDKYPQCFKGDGNNAK